MDKRLPEEFLKRMSLMLGDEYDDFISSYNEEEHHGLRFNTLKCDEKTADRLKASWHLERVPWCETGYYYDPDIHPGRLPYHAAGLYYIQEPSAMLPGELASVLIRRIISQKGYVRVLDMCAAPGGKATHIAGAIGDKGILVVNEPVPTRARILSQNIERLGIDRCMVCCELPERIAEVFPMYFDVTVTDVPCSGEGMFRKDDRAIEEWSPDNVEKCIERTAGILSAADRCLKKDGFIIYSTCTYEKGENEGTIAGFLDKYAGYGIEDVIASSESLSRDTKGLISFGTGDDLPGEYGESIRDAIRHTYRIWPHKAKGEGHYIAVLKRNGGRSDSPDGYSAADSHTMTGYSYDKSISGESKKCFEEFARDVLTVEGKDILVGRIFAYGDNLYIAPDELAEKAVNTKRLRTERPGLHLGEIRKGRFIPSHSLALKLAGSMCRLTVDLDMSDETGAKDAERYIAGESIGCDPSYKGYCLVCVDGHSLGWGKASGGVLKNHYPKGLRYRP